METLALEVVQEIGLYLDPKSYHSLRQSFTTRLPFVQRVLLCYFDNPKVLELLYDSDRKDLHLYCKITQINQTWIQELLDYKQYNLLVPFAHQVKELDPLFYHRNKLLYALQYHQFLYITRLFQNTIFLADVFHITSLYQHVHVVICRKAK